MGNVCHDCHHCVALLMLLGAIPKRVMTSQLFDLIGTNDLEAASLASCSIPGPCLLAEPRLISPRDTSGMMLFSPCFV